MFIICPKCGAKYQIPEGTTLENGQKLKCSACDHLFTKGEESPLVLDKQIAPESEAAPQAFSKPLYTMDDTAEKPTSPIPEVFQPIPESVPKKTGLWIIPIYIILLIVLCIAGWEFRDLLKPSFSDMIPSLPNKPARTITLSKNHHSSVNIPVTEQAQKPVEPVIQQAPVEQKTIHSSETQIAEPIIPQIPQEAEVKTETPEPDSIKSIESPQPILEEPHTQTMPATPKMEAISDSKVLDTEKVPLPPETDSIVETEDDNQPLFEIAAPSKSLSPQITNVSYKIEPDENGISQLLVNGNLVNLESEIQSAPILTLFVYDAQNQVIAQKEIHITNEVLAPSEVVPFYTSITPAPATAARIEVR